MSTYSSNTMTVDNCIFKSVTDNDTYSSCIECCCSPFYNFNFMSELMRNNKNSDDETIISVAGSIAAKTKSYTLCTKALSSSMQAMGMFFSYTATHLPSITPVSIFTDEKPAYLKRLTEESINELAHSIRKVSGALITEFSHRLTPLGSTEICPMFGFRLNDEEIEAQHDAFYAAFRPHEN